MLLRSWLTFGWLHICARNKQMTFCEQTKDNCFYKTRPSLSQTWVRFVIRPFTNLGSFPLLNANTVKSLDEVVQHLCLFARFNGEAVTG